MPPRTVTLALVDRQNRPLGALALPRPVPSGFWPNVDDVVDLAREACGVDVTVLRLLSAEAPDANGGPVTYVTQYDGPLPAGLDRSAITPEWTEPQRLRLPWAQPDGPAASLAWARQALDRPVLAARQMRTWNLSSIWRLDTAAGPVWLKEVPPFFAHEGALLRWLHRPTTPVVLAADGPRMLLADIPGVDRFQAGGAERAGMLALLLEIQVDTAGRLSELLGLGVPDQRFDILRRQVEAVVDRAGHVLADADRRVLDGLAGGLADRFASVAECGVPDTLVHGDFHPGNVRSDGTSTVLIDWGDGVLGHPVMDMLRMRDWEPGGTAPELTGMWCDFWRARVPGSDPARAVELTAPVAGLRDAVNYQHILDSIEPTERPYHADDVRLCLRTAVDQCRTSPGA
ncbi:MAG TPA: aminoglycoside phosphotransferase family protein [Pseudonocardiaceae bacterium]|nr:aminoglycoside phosphotransferase family protein [Pseudonocardiaceae bacterium]